MEKLDYTLITQANTLSTICEKASLAGIVSMDTEFMREKVYFAELCLLQIAVEQEYFLVDILAFDNVESLKPLADLVKNRSVIKLLHSCSQDIEVLYHCLKVKPSAIFDTQLAAAFCGYDGQVGYANLVAIVNGTELDKSQTRTNWHQRPLTEKQLDYAVNDVVYLQELYDTFLLELNKRDRLEWFHEESDNLVQTVIDNANSDLAYKRMSGGNLPASKQSVLKFLANLRERVAQESNKPRPWVLKDTDLYDVVNAMPTKESELFGLNIRSGFLQRNAKKILTFIDQVDQEKVEPVWEVWQPLSSTQKGQVKNLSKLLNDFSEQTGVARSVIANRKDLESFVSGRRVRFQTGWRAKLLGDTLTDALTDE